MKIIVTGLIAQHYTLAGVTWDYLQYLVGFKQLGNEVYYFEDSGEWPYNIDGGVSGNEWIATDCDKNIEYLNSILKRFDLADRWAYYFPTKAKWFGLSNAKRKSVIETADMLINVSGTLAKLDKYSSIKKLVYIDSDPGFTQVKLKIGLKKFIKRVSAHNIHFTFGETLPEYLNDPAYKWKPTRSPIVLSEWTPVKNHRDAYSTIMNWISYKPLKYSRKRYNQKDVEFIKYLDLPKNFTDLSFEVALAKIYPKNWKLSVEKYLPLMDLTSDQISTPSELLSQFNWKVVDPDEECNDIDSYRNYISQSKGEWSVAKGGYVVSESGWFSCRSACYLAAGRPVIVQNTGFDKVLPSGEGILAFNNLNEAVEAVRKVESNYSLHTKRAREIAVEYFDSNKLLTKLIEQSFES